MTDAVQTHAGLILQWRRSRFRLRLFKLLCGLAVVVGLYKMVEPYAFLMWNATESLQGRWFVVVTVQAPRRGDFVAFVPPQNAYYPVEMRFTKMLIGSAGDVITHKGREVFLNGVSVGVARETDSSGRRKLDMIRDGVIPAGYHFVWTPHPRSYDSRYAEIGLVSDAQIIGRAYRLL